MRAPLTRFTVQQWMAAVVVLALTLALAREGSPIRFPVFLMLVGFPVLTTGNRGLTLTLRTDSLGIYCYFVGVVGQAVVLGLDPYVFTSSFAFNTLLGSVRPFGYTLVGLEMALLTLWLWSGEALRPFSGLIAGGLRVGAVFGACVGLMLLHFSVPGPSMTKMMRVLGFIQFLVAHAYYLQGGVAARQSGQKLMTRQKAAAQIAGATLAVVPPLLVQTIARVCL